MKTKEYFKVVHETVIEKHQSGDEDKEISKSLNIPLSKVESIIRKWKLYGTGENLLRVSYLKNWSDCGRKGLLSLAKKCSRRAKEYILQLHKKAIVRQKSGDGDEAVSSSVMSTSTSINKIEIVHVIDENLPTSSGLEKLSDCAEGEPVNAAKKPTRKRKEHSVDVRENVIEKHKSGLGYKKISKSLNIPLSSVTRIIRKWKLYGTGENLPRSGRPRKYSDCAESEPVNAAKKSAKKTKEHSVDVRENVIEKHKSGLGYKVISSSLNIPLSTVKSIIKKWKNYGTGENLPRSGRPQKHSDCTGGEPVSAAQTSPRKRKEYSVDVRENVIEKHKSGLGYKKISKSLNIPLSSVTWIIRKWKAYGTSENLPRSGRPRKHSDCAESEPVNVAQMLPRKRKEYSVDISENVIEKHKSGLGHKKISTSLNIPLSSVTRIIRKWKAYGTGENLPRSGRPRKHSDCTGGEPVSVEQTSPRKRKEYSVDVRENVIEKHKSGLGYKKISKSLNIPLSSVTRIIRKWKAYGTSENLPRSGRPRKQSDCAGGEPVSVEQTSPRKRKEYSVDVRENVIEKHKSGLGYKKISKSLNIPLSSVTRIIRKWKAYGTSENLPRSGRPQKLSDRTIRRLVLSFFSQTANEQTALLAAVNEMSGNVATSNSP